MEDKMLKSIIVLILVGLLCPLLSFDVNEQEGTCKPTIDFYADNLVQ